MAGGGQSGFAGSESAHTDVFIEPLPNKHLRKREEFLKHNRTNQLAYPDVLIAVRATGVELCLVPVQDGTKGGIECTTLHSWGNKI